MPGVLLLPCGRKPRYWDSTLLFFGQPQTSLPSLHVYVAPSTLLYSTFTLLSINIVGLSVKRIRQTKAPGYPLRLYAVQRHETSQRIAEETESIVEVIILSNLQLLWNCQATIPHPPALPGIGAARPGPGPDERYWQTHSNPAST